ncbi:prepilin-type N-terminal cleavage/methylation domain-containing protein [Candidatus Omnitrophota bacterium]
MLRKKGFTLLELIIVIIVIGILASIALPRYLRVAERSRMAEGKSMLGLLRGAQMRYSAEHQVYSAVETDTDAEYTTSRYFDTVVLATADPIASVTRNSLDAGAYDGYVLAISEDGDINCTGTCPE